MNLLKDKCIKTGGGWAVSSSAHRVQGFLGVQWGYSGSQDEIKKNFLGSTHETEQLLFAMFP